MCRVILKMEKIAIGGVIHISFFLFGTENWERNSSKDFSNNEFKRGRRTVEDAPRSGGSKTAVIPEIIVKVHDMVLTNRWMKLRELAEDREFIF